MSSNLSKHLKTNSKQSWETFSGTVTPLNWHHFPMPVTFPLLEQNTQHLYLKGRQIYSDSQLQMVQFGVGWLQSSTGMAQVDGRKKCIHLMEVGKQREKKMSQEQEYTFQIMPPGTHFLQPVHSALTYQWINPLTNTVLPWSHHLPKASPLNIWGLGESSYLNHKSESLYF